MRDAEFLLSISPPGKSPGPTIPDCSVHPDASVAPEVEERLSPIAVDPPPGRARAPCGRPRGARNRASLAGKLRRSRAFRCHVRNPWVTSPS